MNNPTRHIIFFLALTGLLSSLIAQDPPSLIVESLEIQGNSKTRPGVIHDYLQIAEHQTLTRAQVEAAEQRLQNTGFFKSAKILMLPGSEKGMARVQVEIQERKWPYLQFKSGFNELDGWYISPLGIRLDNLLGRGNRLGWELLIGDRVNGVDLEYVRPFLFGSEYDFSIKLFGLNREFLHFLDEGRFHQQIQESGIQFRINGNSGLAKYFSAAFVLQQVRPDSFLTRSVDNDDRHYPVPPFLEVPGDTQKINRFVLAASVDTRDQQIHPRQGWWGSISLDQATRDLGSFASFYRISADIRRYQPLWKQMIGAVRFRWGHTSESAPYYEKFYLGGPNSLRGYADRSLTPAGYAAEIAQASVELRFPLSRRLKGARLNGVLFFDTGQGWNEPDRFDISKLKSGIGYGLRIRLPIVGLLRTDFAYPLHGENRDLRVHVSLGHTF